MHVVLPRLQCDDMFLSCVLIVAAVAVSSEREAKKKQHFHHRHPSSPWWLSQFIVDAKKVALYVLRMYIEVLWMAF